MSPCLIVRAFNNIIMDIRVTNILLKICANHNMSLATLRSKSRLDHVVKARQEAMLELHLQLNLPSGSIAKIFNKKSHVTVLHGIKEALKIRKEQEKQEHSFLAALKKEEKEIEKRLISIQKLLNMYKDEKG